MGSEPSSQYAEFGEPPEVPGRARRIRRRQPCDPVGEEQHARAAAAALGQEPFDSLACAGSGYGRTSACPTPRALALRVRGEGAVPGWR